MPNLPNDSIYLVNTGSNSFAKNPHVAFLNGVYHITWQDMRTRSINYRSATIKNFVGINETKSIAKQIRAYPNPTEGIISLDNLSNMNEIKVYTLSGQLLYQLNLSFEKSVSIDLSKVPKGTYFLEVIGADYSEKQKIIKY